MRKPRIVNLILYLLLTTCCIARIWSSYVAPYMYINGVVPIALRLVFLVLAISVTGYTGLINQWLVLVFVGLSVVGRALIRHNLVVLLPVRSVLGIFLATVMLLLGILAFAGNFMNDCFSK